MMDYFLIELVNSLRASAAVATARAKQTEKEMVDAGLIPPPLPQPPALPLKKDLPRDSYSSISSRSSTPAQAKQPAMDEDEEAVWLRLEAIGVHVGSNFTERYSPISSSLSLTQTHPVYRLCRDKPLFSETLDAIKFICKDIWAACWDKQVDNLRTNHRVCSLLPHPLSATHLSLHRVYTSSKTTPSNPYHASRPG
jgi:trafficking protein particle complex subunit 6